jgi:hypothetical protein
VILQAKKREQLFSTFRSDKEEQKGSCAICISELPEKRKPKKKGGGGRSESTSRKSTRNTCGVNLRTANVKAENVFVASTEEQEQAAAV